jgi:hypothetical protein
MVVCTGGLGGGELMTFGLGMRCGGPEPYRRVPSGIDLFGLSPIVVLPRPLNCHPLPPNSVAKWVAILWVDTK